MNEWSSSGTHEWPGMAILEGRTQHRVPTETIRKDGGKGPTERTSSVFYNIAMADQRTRSVLIMDAAIESGLLGDGDVRVLDMLSGSGIRARRWLHECIHAERLVVTCNDLEEVALSWASAVHALHPPLSGKLHFTHQDGRYWSDRGYQWIDIDPFGSPAPFIDAALSSMGRRGILALTATDAAALRGRSNSACSRRYGARVRPGPASHEIGIRVLIGWAAQRAAMHDRTIQPLFSTCEDHYLRVTLLSERSPSRASVWRDHIGWCVEKPHPIELDRAIWPSDADEFTGSPPLRILLPWHHPPRTIDERVSGPLWTSGLNDERILRFFSEANVLQRSGLLKDSEDVVRAKKDLKTIEEEGMNDAEIISHNAKTQSCIRRRKGLADITDTAMWVGTDELASHLKLSGPPSLNRLVEVLKEEGEEVAPGFSARPGIITSAPWRSIVSNIAEVNPKQR
ncbi:MAG: hypothetical protein CMB77_02135 [Euryarchaeota archaeon]|nr:hypothetical protein [Euryarchaeota archaeon]